jgi:hypothetical protein
MAQTRKRRRKKHRGTQAGSIDRRTGGRPRNRAEARSRARAQSSQRQDRPPSWSSAFWRGLLAAGVFFALMIVAFKRPVGQALFVAIMLLLFYVPFGYFFDQFFYRRRQRQKQQRAREQSG